MWNCILVVCVLVRSGSFQLIYNFKSVIPYQVAGIFESANTQMFAFNESMRHTTDGAIKLHPVFVQPRRTDSFSMWRELCANRAMRPIAVIGPQNPTSDGAVRDQCAVANIPHIQATWRPLDPHEDLAGEAADGSEDERTPNFQKISINFYPNSDEINTAFARLLKFYNWNSFAVLYEDDFGLLRIQKMLAIYTDKYPIVVRRLDPEANNHKIFKELSLYQDSGILLDCHVNHIEHYLNEAEDMKMINHYQHYMFTSLDTSTLADSLKNRPCNSSWLSLSAYDRPDLVQRVGKWAGPDNPNTRNKSSVQHFEIEALMMEDIGQHIMQSLKKIKRKPQGPMCGESVTPWQHGARFQRQILNTSTEGVTGHIEFDSRGRRRNYSLHVYEVYMGQVKIIGRWESANGSQIVQTGSNSEASGPQSTSKVFRIMSRMNKPYFALKEECTEEQCEDEHPEEKYEGFAVDLVRAIFDSLRKEKLDYSYKFIHEDNLEYGKYDEKEKKWDGLIGQLLDKNADLAVCDFTITEERKQVIDFSVPFMTLGISILYVKERKLTPGMFSFLNPYTFDVWLYAATAYFAVSIILFLCARISPADWENPEPCDKDPEELENIWTFKNCAWLTMGSIMTQGCDILPKAFGTRWVCGMWWFFAVIFCQTYIAQLSASMTSALENEPINSVEDLAKQNKILYGVYGRGSTMEFFRTSKDKMYHQMYESMAANPAVLVGSSDEGEKRVKKGEGKYAFFMESSTIDYKLKRDCTLKKVGTELDSKDYGIAMPANSPFRSQINRAILSLKESNSLEEIKDKWWNKKYGAKICDSPVNEDDVEGDLEMANLEGLFVVLVGGLFLCLFVTAAEFINEVRNIVVREKLTHREAFVQELKASLNFFQLQKPILKNPSRAPSVQSSDHASEKKEQRTVAMETFMEFEKEVQ